MHITERPVTGYGVVDSTRQQATDAFVEVQQLLERIAGATVAV